MQRVQACDGAHSALTVGQVKAPITGADVSSSLRCKHTCATGVSTTGSYTCAIAYSQRPSNTAMPERVGAKAPVWMGEVAMVVCPETLSHQFELRLTEAGHDRAGAAPTAGAATRKYLALAVTGKATGVPQVASTAGRVAL
eukprot:6868949-Prymnesium_polylepis.2